MKKYILLLLTICAFISCGEEPEKMIYKTKSGEFASKQGKFIADFPTKPYYSSIDHQVGVDKFKVHSFRSKLGPSKNFTVEYTDYPDHFMQSMTDEEAYSQGVANLTNKMSENFNLDFQEPTEQHGLTGRYFVLSLQQHVIATGTKGYMEGKIFKSGNRVYTITYMGQNHKNVDEFMNSFRLIK